MKLNEIVDGKVYEIRNVCAGLDGLECRGRMSMHNMFMVTHLQSRSILAGKTWSTPVEASTLFVNPGCLYEPSLPMTVEDDETGSTFGTWTGNLVGKTVDADGGKKLFVSMKFYEKAWIFSVNEKTYDDGEHVNALVKNQVVMVPDDPAKRQLLENIKVGFRDGRLNPMSLVDLLSMVRS